MSTSPQRTAPRGRPADPSVEARALNAAVELYSEVGWNGFTMDAVASRAKVGKAALYRRWPTKQELLTNAIAGSKAPDVSLRDTGDLRTDLETMAEGLIGALHTPRGLAELRLQLEAKIYPEILDQAMDPIRSAWTASARTYVAAAVSRGQLPDTASPTLIFDAIRGAIINRFLLTPSHRSTSMLEGRHELAQRVVGLALASFG
ncbi:TetR/AcrR family transcriptional regulator [Arthrobacter ginkgonis]|uniref:TetR/AcrR family transcriptional regulator n=1 Tax=Arthrobacter ginkgonis TaxID=1630594 RepID=A0ABP7DBV9_9MICC